MLSRKSVFLTLFLAGCLVFIGGCRKKLPDNVAAGTVVAEKSTAKPAGDAKIAPTIVLTLVDEIPSKFGPGPDDYFWNISGLCFDSEDALYVADRGWAKVFKLDARGRFLKTFGRRGEGPGEFSVDDASFMEVAVGNDGFLYVSGGGLAARISRFDREGKYLDSRPAKSGGMYPAAGSNGEICLVAAGPELISVFPFGASAPRITFFPEGLHFGAPFLESASRTRQFVSSIALPIMRTKNDGLVVVSNVSLKAFIYGPDYLEINRFDVGDKDFREKLLKRYEALVKRRPTAGINPFTPVLSPDQRLYLFTFNAEREAFDALVYSLEGRLETRLQIPADVGSPFAVNARGEVFGVRADNVIVRFKSPFPPET